MRIALLFFVCAGAAALHAEGPVSYGRILHAAAEPGNWLTYSGGYAGLRHSSLGQITPANVAGLKPAWVYQSRDAGVKWECTPLAVDGILYVTEAPNVVSAIDERTGRPLWHYRRNLPSDVVGCCGPVNRGLAILGDAVFLGTYDCHVVCLDAATGTERWDVVAADYKAGYSMTAAPLAVKDKILVGSAGDEYGIRGFLDAYDPKTGARLWRLWTVPAPGEPHHDTWAANNDAWRRGGAATWITGSYDPELNVVYWGTGNPGPDYNDDWRPGDNLYTNCVLAINPDTGRLLWHFQYTPHDTHDFDSNQVPMLVDAPFGGRMRRLLFQANRNGFYYVLDRTTGEFLAGRAVGKVNWASGLDARGRVMELTDKRPTPEGVLVYPGESGVLNWASPSYDPATGLVYVQAQNDYGQVFYKIKPNQTRGANYTGGGFRNELGKEPPGAIKAIEATSGRIRWEFSEQDSSNSGVLTTASGLLFSGTREGEFFALDAANGALLWHFAAGGQIHGGPVTYLVGGRQAVAVTAGNGLFVFML